MKVCSGCTISNTSMEDQFTRSFRFFRTRPLPWLAVLVGSIALGLCLGYGFLSIFLTSSALVLCPIVLTFSSRPESSCNQILMGKAETLNSHNKQISSKMEEVADLDYEHQSNAEKADGSVHVLAANHYNVMTNRKEAEAEKIEDEHGRGRGFSDSLFSSISDSESTNGRSTLSEEYEMEWSSRDYSTGIYNQECSDGSISDEESLIEIALPTGHYVDTNAGVQEPNPRYNFQHKWPMPDCSMESLFRQQSLLELFSEMNEEDNMIEIDISVGSIKCPRFEIKA